MKTLLQTKAALLLCGLFTLSSTATQGQDLTINATYTSGGYYFNYADPTYMAADANAQKNFQDFTVYPGSGVSMNYTTLSNALNASASDPCASWDGNTSPWTLWNLLCASVSLNAGPVTPAGAPVFQNHFTGDYFEFLNSVSGANYTALVNQIVPTFSANYNSQAGLYTGDVILVFCNYGYDDAGNVTNFTFSNPPGYQIVPGIGANGPYTAGTPGLCTYGGTIAGSGTGRILGGNACVVAPCVKATASYNVTGQGSNFNKGLDSQGDNITLMVKGTYNAGSYSPGTGTNMGPYVIDPIFYNNNPASGTNIILTVTGPQGIHNYLLNPVSSNGSSYSLTANVPSVSAGSATFTIEYYYPTGTTQNQNVTVSYASSDSLYPTIKGSLTPSSTPVNAGQKVNLNWGITFGS